MKYRSVDATEVEANVLRQRAIMAEQEAYQQEVEIKRLDAVAPLATTDEDKAQIAEAKKAAEQVAKENRARAARLNKAKAATTEELAEAKKNFLNGWINSLESEHVAHTTLLKQRQASLKVTGANAPTDADKERIKTNIKANEDALQVIESAWKVATTELDALPE